MEYNHAIKVLYSLGVLYCTHSDLYNCIAGWAFVDFGQHSPEESSREIFLSKSLRIRWNFDISDIISNQLRKYPLAKLLLSRTTKVPQIIHSSELPLIPASFALVISAH